MFLFLLQRVFNARYNVIFHRPKQLLDSLEQGEAGIFEGRRSLAVLKSKTRTDGDRDYLRRS